MNITLSAIIKKLLVLFLIFFGLFLAKDFLMPIFMGAIIAMLYLPMCQWIENHKVPKSLAVFACIISFLLFITIMFAVLGYKTATLVTDVEILKQKTVELLNNFQQYIFKNLNITASQQIKILSSEQPSYANLAQSAIGALTGAMSSFVLIVVYFAFLLYYRSHIKNFLVLLTARFQHHAVNEMIQQIAHVSQQYLLGLFKMIFLLWIMYGVGFSILGVKNALFFAIMCGMLEIIPFVGNLIGTMLTVMVAVINGGNLELIIGIIAVYGVVQFIQGWVLEPLIVGSQVKINSLFTIIALILGELLWGIPGVILAIPITAMFKIVCDHIPDMKPYGFLIGEIDKPKQNTSFATKLKSLFYKKVK